MGRTPGEDKNEHAAPHRPAALAGEIRHADDLHALELLDPAYRTAGFTAEPLRCIYPDLQPIVGYARTGTIRSLQPSRWGEQKQKEVRVEWYRYVDEGGPKPSIVVLQDLDGVRAGFGSFWGEVNSHVHRGLGALGVITNGSIRDIPMNAGNFQMLAGSVMPSHAHVHIVDMDVPVTVAGMAVQPNDLIHADQHGAVVIPQALAVRIADAVALIAARETLLIEASKKDGFTWQHLKAAIMKTVDIH